MPTHPVEGKGMGSQIAHRWLGVLHTLVGHRHALLVPDGLDERDQRAAIERAPGHWSSPHLGVPSDEAGVFLQNAGAEREQFVEVQLRPTAGIQRRKPLSTNVAL